MLGPGSLVLTASTLGCPPFRELVEAAHAGGFEGLSLWPVSSYQRARAEGCSDAELRALLADHGLEANDVDACVAWVGPDDPGPPYYEEPSERELFAAAEALGAPFCNVLLASRGVVSREPGAALPVEAAAEVFAGICDRAARHGITAYLEFSPGSAVRDARTALAIVEATGRANAGLLVDTWHCHHGGASFDELRALPGARVLGVQVSDVPARRPTDFARATRRGRLVPGEGVFDWTRFLRTLAAIGSPAPLTLEVLNDELAAAQPPSEHARRLGAVLRELVAAAREA
jgi:sugar phosphate isomerase/epimerase